jgi:hypothetical protein
VTTWTVLQHIPPDRIGAACSEVRRVLAREAILLLCEETRLADRPVVHGPHTWHRHPEHYQQLFTPLKQVYCRDIVEISRLRGVESPGTVMMWVQSTNR